MFLDGKQVGIFDRRRRRYSVNLPPHSKPAQLDILIETMGHVNFGKEIHDRKGSMGDVKLGDSTLKGDWQVFPLPLDDKQLAGLKWKELSSDIKGPAFCSASFDVEKPADTFLDLQNWGKGVIWVNGHCLSRFWNIGPTQTAYLPGAWLKAGWNEIIALDLLGPSSPVMSGVKQPVLDKLRPELDFASKATAKATLHLDGLQPVLSASIKPGGDMQEVKLPSPASGSQFCLESLNAHDAKPYAAIAELDLLDAQGASIPHQNWSIGYVDSEELADEDGSASNAIDGQSANSWHSAWKTPPRATRIA